MERVLFAPGGLPPLPPDVAEDPSAYSAWVQQREDRRVRSSPRTAHAVLHLVMVVDHSSPEDVQRTLTSLRDQRSGAWRLTIVAPESAQTGMGQDVRRHLHRHQHRRVHLVAAAEGHMSPDSFHRHLREVGHGGAALIHPGDVWAPDATAILGTALTPRGVVYADEDEPTSAAGISAPIFKPAYSPDFLLATGYVGRPMAMGWQVAQSLPPLVAQDRVSLDHECALAACANADSVQHIPEVLCHRAQSFRGPSASSPTGDHVIAELRRRDDHAEVRPNHSRGSYLLVRRPSPVPPVSIVVPFRDEPQFLRTCIDSVTDTTHGHDVELILVDNGSSDPEVLTLVERLDQRRDVRVIEDARPFNWAQLNNVAARNARGDVLVFLNNDIEAHREGWLAALVGHAVRPDVGAVGARLLYPDGRIQHCGVVIGLIGAAGHPLIGLDGSAPGYLQMAVTTRECAAVTGACLATRREVFEQLAGFDETLGVDLNDVDFCLRAGQAGLRTVYEPAAELIHYESPSRGKAGGVGDIVNFIERWRDYIAAGDPYFNAHLTRTDASCRLANAHEEERWQEWYATVTAT